MLNICMPLVYILVFHQALIELLLVKLLSHTQNFATYDFMTVAFNERW